MNKLILTVGNIASGKSTWCREKAKEGAVIICNDDITTMIHGGNYSYNKDLKSVYKSIEIAAVIVALTAGKTVIIDRLNQTKHQRRKWIGIASSFDVPCYVVEFDRKKPEIHAGRRDNKDDRGYSYQHWLKVAKHFDDTYEEPTLEEGLSAVANDKISI